MTLPASSPDSPLKKAARPILDWFAPGLPEAAAAEIQAAGGREVFFVGRLSPEGVVVEAEVAARGTQGAVPAIAQAARPGDLVLHNHPSGVLRPSEADLEVASALGADGIGFAILDNDCTSIYVMVEPSRPERAAPLDLGVIEAFFAPDGPLAEVLEGYEPRSEQTEMALAAAGAFNDGRVVVVEAGTGVGKGLAYLVPALLWATANRKRVVVSTNTINLQEQLMGSDLPLLEKAGLSFHAVLVKGRRNYACLRKADEIRSEPDLFGESETDAVPLKELADWAFATSDGSLADLPTPPPGDLWGEIATEADDCTRARCSFYNECHFYRARRRAASADLLVVNHHLLFADLALRQAMGTEGGTAVLPPYSHAIMDEAHHVEEVATTHFGTEISSIGLQRQMGRLQHRRRSSRGLLPLLVRHLAGLAGKDDQAERALALLEEEVRPALAMAAQTVPTLFKGLDQAVQKLLRGGGEERRLRITEAVESEPAWEDNARETCRKLRSELLNLTGRMDRLLRTLDPLRDAYREDLDSPFIDIAAVAGRLNAAATALGRFIDPEDLEEEATVRWLERSSGRGDTPRLTLSTAPIEVGPYMARAVYDRLEGAVLTSATLAVDGSFDFIAARLGLDRLDRGRLVTDVLKSPFVHAEQARLLIPTDFPDPNEAGHEAQIAELLLPAITAAGGRSLVLLTSYGSLLRIHEMLAGPLAEAGIRLRRQGEAPRSDLLDALRVGQGEALLATDSFWEGIDVRGDALSLLVLGRLPFRVPTEPVLQARAEKMEREGENAFTGFLVPMAVLKFKQGMGRLIRHRQDRGIALILDPRILRKGYGHSFLDSLDWGEPTLLPADQVLGVVQEWFTGRGVS